MSTSPRRATDPWLLPNIPEHLAKTTIPADAPPPPAPLPRPGDSVETMRAMYQSRRRGTSRATCCSARSQRSSSTQ
ncbi:hypothetical protein IEO21_09819 [Rhodonia placenta]|uniref:Uncharacterized protein n=1 Tax=Rhodonia placenta TaxID=104341 RepID=A0A8H7NTK9_9APHY|nr:hypothetical protein IEO21_09819 [Postia placenta]